MRIGLYHSSPSPTAGAPPIRTLVLDTGGRVGDLAADETGATAVDESAERVDWNCSRTRDLIRALKRADVVKYEDEFYRIVGQDRPARNRIIIQGERIR